MSIIIRIVVVMCAYAGSSVAGAQFADLQTLIKRRNSLAIISSRPSFGHHVNENRGPLACLRNHLAMLQARISKKGTEIWLRRKK
jgi:hypothetical protein